MTDKALTTYQEMMSLAEAFARSGFFADANDQAKAIVKIQAGRELGIPPVAAMTTIYVVKGKVTLSATCMAALVKRHPLYDYRVVEQTDTSCAIEFYQGQEALGISTFSLEDAQRAGLNSSPTWRMYPRNMLFARAMSNGVRWYCPDVLGGAPIYDPTELGAEMDEDGEIVVEAEDVPLKPRTDLTGIGKDPSELIAKGKTETPHWIKDAKVRARFWQFCGTLGLDDAQVHQVLGVERVEDFGGSMQDAKTLLEAAKAE